MSIHTDQINKLYRLVKKFNKDRIRNFSQVGEKYDPEKFDRKNKMDGTGLE